MYHGHPPSIIYSDSAIQNSLAFATDAGSTSKTIQNYAAGTVSTFSTEYLEKYFAQHLLRYDGYQPTAVCALGSLGFKVYITKPYHYP